MTNKQNQELDKIVEGLDVELIEFFDFMYRLMIKIETTEFYKPNIRYSRTYFANYYSVDIKTFNKWIEFFIPELKVLTNNKIRKKQFDIIISKLGPCDTKKMKTYTRLEIANEIFNYRETGKQWSQSKKYREVNTLIKGTFKGIKNIELLSKYPPKIGALIIKNETEKNLFNSLKLSRENHSKDELLDIVLTELKTFKNRSYEEVLKDKKKLKKELKELFEK